METRPLENDPTYASTHHHKRRERWVKLIVAAFVLAGTLATAIASVIGANTPKSVVQQTNVGGDIIIGYQVMTQVLTQGKLRVPASKAPEQAPVIVVPPPVKKVDDPIRQNRPDTSQEFPVGVIPDASCYGLDQSVWAVSAEPVLRLTSGPTAGYNVNLRLHNIGTKTAYVFYSGDTFIRDDAGNRNKMTTSTIQTPHFGFGGDKVDPGAYYPVSLTFVGPTQSGSKAGFDIQLLMNIMGADGKPTALSSVVFGCTKLPVAGSPSTS